MSRNPKDIMHITRHAANRMNSRFISQEIIDAVLEFGRSVFTRGALIYAIGAKEVQQFKRQNIDLSMCEGVQVVCSTDGHIITVYRNHCFRGMRPGLGRKRRASGFRRN